MNRTRIGTRNPKEKTKKKLNKKRTKKINHKDVPQKGSINQISHKISLKRKNLSINQMVPIRIHSRCQSKVIIKRDPNF